MKVFTSLDLFPIASLKPLYLALGNFDGIHLGHQKILQRVITDAKAKKGLSAVITFDEHPQLVLHPEKKPALLTSRDHRLFLLDKLGIDVCFQLHFSKEFSKISAQDFVKEILVKKLKIQKIYLGFNARFGRDRAGDAAMLQQMAGNFAFDFEQIGEVTSEQETVSSSRLREVVQRGELALAEKCLGRPFSVLGTVIHGDGRGSALGFPTANLSIAQEVLPPQGVYAVWARSIQRIAQQDPTEYEYEPGAWLQGVLNYGTRPTFHPQEKTAQAEVFILNGLSGIKDLYGEWLEVVFVERIRDEMKFPSAEDLQKRIRQDVQAAQKLLLKNP